VEYWLALLMDLVEKVGFVVGAKPETVLDDNKATRRELNFMLMCDYKSYKIVREDCVCKTSFQDCFLTGMLLFCDVVGLTWFWILSIVIIDC
jgi:hypothetical protein